MNSSSHKPNRNLAKLSEREAKHFLIELANLRDREAFTRFFSRFGPLLCKLKEITSSNQDRFWEVIKDALHYEPWEISVIWLRDSVRRFWRESDHRTREYQTFLLQQEALRYEYGTSFDGATPLPAPSQLEQAFIYLRK